MKFFIRMAWRNVFTNWRRSLLTGGSIAAGLAGLIFIWACVEGTNEQMINGYVDNLTGHLQVHRRGFYKDRDIYFALDDPRSIMAQLSRFPGISGLAERIEGKVFLLFRERSTDAVLIGVEPSEEVKVTNLWKSVKMGRYLQTSDTSAIVLGQDMSRQLKANLGDQIAVVTQAADGSVGAARYKVVGIYSPRGSDAFGSNYAFVNLNAARDLFALWGRSTGIVIRANNRYTAYFLLNLIINMLGTRDFEVMDWWQLVPDLVNSYNMRKVFAYLTLLTVFLIVASGITNTILMSVTERMREFGIMMALGTRGYQIIIIIILESLLLGAISIVVGGIIGAGIVSIFNITGISFNPYARYLESGALYFPLVVYPLLTFQRLCILSAMVLLVSVLAAVYPAIKASRLRPIAAIRQVETI